MSVKILSKSITGLDNLCQDPHSVLSNTEQGTVAVFHDNQPLMYVVTPHRLAELLAAEQALNNQSNIALDEQFFDEQPQTTRAPVGKFAIYPSWQPDNDFIRQAAMWGIALQEAVTPEELAGFIAYWQAEGRVFHHVQWQQKLARHLQVSRGNKTTHSRRDFTQLSVPDSQVPKGFRGE